jgi:alkylhydroperoxidase family enzyme
MTRATLTDNPDDTDVTRRSTARIPLHHNGLLARLVAWGSRRIYGDELDVARAMLNHRGVLWTTGRFERSLARWHALDADLKVLAVMASASVIGCSWCIDFGHYQAMAGGRFGGRAADTLRQVPTWRTSTAFTTLERKVLAYTEAMTLTPPAVTDQMVAELRADLGDAAVVELTMMVAVENQRSRFNAALGLRSQGFADRCEIPA